MEQVKPKRNIVAIITMVFLFMMISFVTNLAAPIGVIWKNQPELAGSNFLGMLGNMMNFLAYLFMGIPSGKLLSRIGYKKMALTAVSVGFLGIFIQYLSGRIGVGDQLFSLPLNFYVYLLGAFVAGFSMCMLNIVVNPMLNLLGGGKNGGNQLIQIAGTFNSLVGTLSPMLVGALIGNITVARIQSGQITIASVYPVLYITMGVFLATFIALSFIPIPNPTHVKSKDSQIKLEYSPWKFRHFVLGAIAIFIYVGLEVGTPGTLNFFLSDTSAKGGGLSPENAAAIGGFVAGTYWFLMLIGRLLGSLVAGKVSSKTMIMVMAAFGMLLVALAIFFPKSNVVSMPVFTGSSFNLVSVPINALFLVLVGLCTAVMWGGIFNLATEGLGKYTAEASGIFMMMVVGGGILPLLQNKIADLSTFMGSYWVVFIGFAYILFYAAVGSKNVNKDIPVE